MKKAFAAVLGVAFGLFGLAGTASAQGGNQRFIVFGSGSGAEESAIVIAVGPITGVGTFEETEDPDVVRFVFDEGSITLHVPNDEESEEFDERTCSGSFTFGGPFEIIGGTEAYAEASGSGRFQGQGRFFGERTLEGCSEDEEAGFFFFVVNATGNVSLDDQAAA
jgi:hypothetical protein